MTIDFNAMSGPELAAAFNQMAAAKGAGAIKKFKDRATGIRRCQELAGTTTNVSHVSPGVSSVLRDIKFKSSSREAFRDIICDNFGHQVDAKEFNGKVTIKIGSAIGGIDWVITKANLPYRLRVEKKDGKVKSVGLYAKSRSGS